MSTPPSRPFAAIIVAAGQGARSGQKLPKQFALWRGKPVVRHSAELLLASGAKPLVIAIPPSAQAQAHAALAGLDGYVLVEGGATRQASVTLALERLAADAPAAVLIHDAARPDCPPEVIERLLAALAQHPAAIPVLPVVDSIATTDQGETMTGSADRVSLRRVQTPQAFRFADILAAHRAWDGDPGAGDDAQVAQAAGLTVAMVEGTERLHKLTYAADFAAIAYPRVGTGYDVHRLAEGEELWLCGIKVPHARGLAGHSDADVGLHALVDAILGACGGGDIGQHFPPSDPQWRGAPSSRFVEHAVELARRAGYRIGNADVTLICEAPKVGPFRDTMRQRIAELLGVTQDAVNVKATTTERLGFAGRSEGIAAQAAVLLVPLERT